MLSPSDQNCEAPLAASDHLPAEENGTPTLALVVDDRPEAVVERRWQDFVELIAHEMRNPLTSIVGYTQLLQRRGTDDPRALATIAAQARQLNRLIGDLLDSTRLEADRLKLQAGLDRHQRAGPNRDRTGRAGQPSPRHPPAAP